MTGLLKIKLTEIGNTITNQRQFDISGRFNLVSLYNKNKFLAKVNQKFTPTTRVASASSRNRRTPPAPLKVEKDIKLSPDTTGIVTGKQIGRAHV